MADYETISWWECSRGHRWPREVRYKDGVTLEVSPIKVTLPDAPKGYKGDCICLTCLIEDYPMFKVL